MRRASVALALLAAFVLVPTCGTRPAHAAILGFTVDTTTDAKDANVGDGKCATSSNKCSLRAAIQEMDALGQSTNNITLPSGTYTLTISGSNEDKAATGDLDIRVQMKILGTVGSTVVKGGSSFGDRIFDVPSGISGNFTLNGVDIENGDAPSTGRGGGLRFKGTGLLDAINVNFRNNSAGKSGGGLYQESGTIDFNLVTFDGNSAAEQGGGADLEGSVVATNFTHLTFTNNSGSEGGGLAAFVTGTPAGSIPKLDASTFTGNSTTSGGSGGGLAIARTQLRTSTVSGNTAGYGGGIEVVGSTVPTVIQGKMFVTGNTATVSGGGIYTKSCGASCGSLLHVTIDSNVAHQDGSGMYVNGGLFVEKTTIENNTTTGQGVQGGALYHAGDATGPLLLTNMTVGQNTDGPVAGGVVAASKATDVFTNVTIADNGGGTANGVSVTGSGVGPKLLNTIVSSSGTNCNKALQSQGHNMDSGNSCGFNQSGDLRNTDPLLHPLEDNGGGTWTMRPMNLSPTLDTGTNAGCPVTDQRSVFRPVDGDLNGSKVCDIGAYEDGVRSINSDIGFDSVTPTVNGSTVTYTMNMKSTGEYAGLNSVLTDVLPSSLTFISCTATDGGLCSGSGNLRTVTWLIINIGATPVVTIKATIVGSGKIIDTVTVWSENPDWFPVDNTASATIQV